MLYSKVGTFKSGNWALDVNGDGVWNGCTIDRCLSFGGPGDVPLTGDWSGDGIVSVGSYNLSQNTFYLDWNHNGYWDGEPLDKKIVNLVSADSRNVPIVGRWGGGVGHHTVGMYRAGSWWLDKDGDGAITANDWTGTFGSSGDLPLVGPWKSVGQDLIGSFNPTAAQFFLDSDATRSWSGSCPPDTCSGSFALTTDKPVAGLWVPGNGKGSFGVFRDGAWYLDANNNYKWDDCTSDFCITQFGSAGDTPVVGWWPAMQVSRGHDVNFGTVGSQMWENTAAVVPPGAPNCPAGRGLITFGQDPWDQTHAIDLACLESGTCSTPKTTMVLHNGPSQNTTDSPLPSSEWAGTDNQTVRVGNDVYVARLAFKDDFNVRTVGAAIMHSADCGAHWDQRGFIDATTALPNHECSISQATTTMAAYDPVHKTLTIDRDGDFNWDSRYDPTIDLTAAGTNFQIQSGDTILAGNFDGWAESGTQGSTVSHTALARFRAGQWLIDANRNFNDDGCLSDTCFSYGQAGDIPVVGRFMAGGDNNLRSQVGVFRPATHEWFLDSNGDHVLNAGDTHITNFGQAGDIPVVGDWLNSGTVGRVMRVGVARPNGNQLSWYLDQGADGWQGCSVDKCYTTFGTNTSVPVAGVWATNPFRDAIGTFDGGRWNLDSNADGTFTSGTDASKGNFGAAGMVPIPGFWQPVPGGFDRPELHYNPVNGMMHMTATCNGHVASQPMLFSTVGIGADLGKTWKATKLSGLWSPMTMASTANRLYLFSVVGLSPVLMPVSLANVGTPSLTVTPGSPTYVYQSHGAFSSEPGGATGVVSFADNARAVENVKLCGDAGHPDGATAVFAIGTSGSTDSLLAAYQSGQVDAGVEHRVTRLMRVDLSVNASTATVSAVTNLDTISGLLTNGRYPHVAASTLIAPEPGSEYSMIYWKAVDLGVTPPSVSVKAAVLRNPVVGTYSRSSYIDLSTDGNNAPRAWSGHDGRTGDYQTGAAYTENGLPHFLAQWVETPYTTAAPPAALPRELHTSVISVHP